MAYYLIVCRSLTYAQRSLRLLERAGISAYLVRAPKLIAEAGCAYCVKVSQRSIARGLELLRREGLTPRKIYLEQSKGEYREVDL